MAFSLNYSQITKKTIDLLVEFIRERARSSRLYQQVQVSDRFDLEATRLPCVIVKNVSNTQRRTDFGDFIKDIDDGRVQAIPISADDALVGNNVQATNLPNSVNFDPRWPLDISIGIPTGVDINEAIYTNPTGSTTFDSGTNTGIIITLPSAGTFEPTSLVYALDCPRLDGTANPINPAAGTGVHNLAVALSADQEQFYLVYSGDSIAGTILQPIQPDQFIVNASGLVPGLSGTIIKMSDVLWAGDQYRLETYNTDQYTYQMYGGIYDTNISFECYAGSTIESQELGDLVERFLVEQKKVPENTAGLHLTGWSQPGQSEQDYINTHIFSTSVAAEGFIWWQDYRNLDVITSASGVAIPSGIFLPSGQYASPGVQTSVVFNNPTYLGGLSNL